MRGAALLLALACAAPLPAQTGFSLRLDNDILALRGRGAPPDFDYTHGLHAALELGPRLRVRAGQEIYTPRRDAPTPIPGERPYAAWLYAGAATAAGERSLSLDVGVVGPAALGEPVQNGAHRLLGSRRQEGWAHQLGNRPGFLLRYSDGRVLRRGAVRAGPRWSTSLGTVRVAAEVGASVGIGSGRGPFAEAAAAQAWVAHDVFLDGSAARRLPFVTTGEAAAGYAFRRWSLEYRFTARTRQYRAQPEGHTFGSLVLRTRPRGATTGEGRAD